MTDSDDASRIAALISKGLFHGETRWVSHDLYFPQNADGALSAYEEFGPDPFAMLDEEVEGGGHWHVVVFRKHEITVESLAVVRDELGGGAARHGGTYGGWVLTYKGNGSTLPPEGDLIFGSFENPYPFP
jgi:Regulator of ribonuclease activity B